MRASIALCLGLALLPFAAVAQEDDRTFLVGFLEDNLSSAGRKITITGFAGALSSVATIDQLTIADDDGIWITLNDISLGWDRSALFSGSVQINQLAAEEIILDRMPVAGGDSTLPAVAGSAFSLPELPVSVNIDNIAAEYFSLGEGVLGETVAGSVAASVSLVAGEGKVVLNIDRQDEGPSGLVALEAGYSNASGQLMISLDAQEDAGGIAVRLLSVPGAPSAGLSIQGSGPIDDFVAKISLQTDGQPRLTGQVELLGKEDGGRSFAADLSGDLAPVFWPAYREFLGSSLNLLADGTSFPDGRFEISNFALASGALNATGQLALAPDGLPERFSMNVAIKGADDAPIVLPLTTEVLTKITSARLNLGFDAADGEAWTLGGLILGLDRADFKSQSLSLSGGGNIARGVFGQRVTADLSFIALGLEPTDPALAQALGKTAAGSLVALWESGSGETEVKDLSLSGEDYAFNANGAIQGLETGFAFDGRITGKWDDLARLQGLAGLPLQGAAEMNVSGSASAMGDAFDLRFAVTGQDLRMGISEVDNLLSGTSQVTGEVTRGPAGTALRDVAVTAGDLSGTLNGVLTPDAVNLTADVALPDLSALGNGYRGSISGAATYSGSYTTGDIGLRGTAQALGIGQVMVDRLLAGSTDLQLSAALVDGAPQLRELILDGQLVDLTATGASDGALQVSAQLANLGVIVPEFPGALTMTGPLRQTAAGTSVDLALRGPAQVSGQLTGTIDPGFANANLAFNGQSLADVANPFLRPRALSGQLSYDLTLNGPLALSSLSGRIGLSGGRLADPGLNFGFDAIQAQAGLSAGQMQLSATTQVTTGGSVSITGQSQIALPFVGALKVDLQQVALSQARLFETTVTGALTVTGPLAGGAVVAGALDLGRTELRIPSTGLGGSEPIPTMTHIAEPADVRLTRKRAGLLDDGSGKGRGGGASYGLDILLRAPNQIFLRGRGLDAELGGNLRLLGTTNAISPQGSFELIRGRLSLVGRRLTLTQASLVLQGDFVPRIDIVASIEDTDIISTIRISGPADEPVLSFESSPPLPDEEVLAQLLFGKTLQGLSAFQAAQLAIAVRTLAGVGGEGLVGKIRSGTGLDNLDITTDEEGNASLTAGKYLSEKVYTEVTIDPTGKTQIDLNFDVRPHVTLKGSVDSDGNTGVGIYLEKNY